MIKRNKKVMESNKEQIFPGVGNDIITRSIGFTQENLDNLDRIKKEYGVGRSAVFRILLHNFLENKNKKIA